MKKRIIRLVYGLTLVCLSQNTFGQNNVGINTETPNSRAVLQLVSPTNDQGFLVPGMTTTQRTAGSFTSLLTSSENSLLVFDTDLNSFYYWVDNGWVALSSQELAAGTGLTISGNTITNTGDLDSTNEIQDLSLSGNTLAITANGSATQIDLSPYLDNTDAQTLTLSGTDLSISNGNTIDLSGFQDGTGTDDQQLSIAGDLLSLEDGGSVDLSGYLDNTDGQTLSLTATSLAISGGNSVDLAGLQDGTGTDDQQLSLAANSLSLEDGGSVDLSPYLDNTDAQNLANVLGNGNSAGSVQISDLADPIANQDAATKAYVDAQVSAVDINDADSDPSNELQDLSLSGNTLTLTGLTTPTAIDLSPYAGTNTDNQTLSFAANSLSISGGNTVDLSSLQDGTGTDDQALTFDRDILQLEDGGSVDLSGYLDNTDAQTLALTGTSLSITGGNSVDLAAVQDGTGTDNQTIDELSLTTGVLSISLSGDGQPAQTVDLTSLQDGTGTDNQTIDELSLATGILSISLSGDGQPAQTVNLTSLQDGTGTDDQVASEVPVTAGNGMTSTNVQSALAEHQTDINGANSNISTLNSRVTSLEASKTDYLYLTATDFLPLYSASGNDARYTENQVFIMAGEAGSTGQLKAILELPDRATVSTVEAYGENSASTTLPSSLTLYSVGFGDNKLQATSLGSASLIADSGTFQPMNFGVDKQIDNSNNMYYFIFQGQGGVSTQFSSLYYVKITYTY